MGHVITMSTCLGSSLTHQVKLLRLGYTAVSKYGPLFQVPVVMNNATRILEDYFCVHMWVYL